MASLPQDLERYLKKHKAVRGGIHTHTRIPDTNNPEVSQIWGGSYNILTEELPILYSLVAKKLYENEEKEYLTECQLKDKGPILIDLDFRFPTEITERQHDAGFIDDVVDRYFENLKKILKIPEGTEIPVYIFEKPHVNILEDKTKDGIHIVIGIILPFEEQQLLRKEVLKDFHTITSALPIIDGWGIDDIIDPCIPKGKTNWQMYGSRKPFNEAYEIVSAYRYSFDEDGDLESQNIISELEAMPKNELLAELSAHNTNYPSFQPTKYCKDNAKNFTASNKKKKKKRKVNIVMGINSACKYEDISNQTELDAQIKLILNDPSKADYYLKEIHDFTMVLGERFYSPFEKWMEVGWALHNTDYRLFLTWVKFSSKSPKFNYNEHISVLIS